MAAPQGSRWRDPLSWSREAVALALGRGAVPAREKIQSQGEIGVLGEVNRKKIARDGISGDPCPMSLFPGRYEAAPLPVLLRRAQPKGIGVQPFLWPDLIIESVLEGMGTLSRKDVKQRLISPGLQRSLFQKVEAGKLTVVR